jgi:hypothetical protein
MKEVWLQYNDVICMSVFYSFGILWLSLNWYIYACYKMSNYKKQIDENGYITNTSVSYPFFNPFMIRHLFSAVPPSNNAKKYYKHEAFKKQTNKIKSYRRIYIIVFPIYIFILIPLVIYFMIQYK